MHEVSLILGKYIKLLPRQNLPSPFDSISTTGHWKPLCILSAAEYLSWVLPWEGELHFSQLHVIVALCSRTVLVGNWTPADAIKCFILQQQPMDQVTMTGWMLKIQVAAEKKCVNEQKAVAINIACHIQTHSAYFCQNQKDIDRTSQYYVWYYISNILLINILHANCVTIVLYIQLSIHQLIFCLLLIQYWWQEAKVRLGDQEGFQDCMKYAISSASSRSNLSSPPSLACLSVSERAT